MTLRTTAALALAALLLGAAPAHAADIPKPGVKPNLFGKEVPKPAEQKAGESKPGDQKPGDQKPGEPPKAADQTAGAATPMGDWAGGPSMAPDGKLAYCVTEAVFDSGHTLMIARNAKGELNVGLQIPGASLPRGQDWPVKVTIDDKLVRERMAIATQADMLVVPHGPDEDLFNALMNGKELAVVSDSDRIAFQLKGTKKALVDLKTCVDKGGNVPKKAADAKPAQGKGALPDELLSLLATAGIRNIEPVSLDNVALDKRPADYLWRSGPVMGSVRQHTVGDDATLAEISRIYQDAMTKACAGKAAMTYADAEALPGVMLRTGAVDCTTERGTVHAALLLYLTDARLFTMFAHEVDVRDADATQADRMRDRIAEVIRELALKGPQSGRTKG
ncbi:hypothetical protein [Azospirillum sp.]|uniref:hypothetical protein n=1 Tax=Azospirillum sp. TaxID=34012 RepID=UPI002D2F2EA7|nr:hypothetical protein [Azospirillum sp.]HYD67698.1 hypothetical protein [Azospirillum sp.]